MSPENLVPLCRLHHVEQHFIGWPAFVAKYPVVEFALAERGWSVALVLGQRRLVRG